MLTPAQTEIIRSTVPLLETGGETLTKHFYELMLREHPEVRPLFNQAHQASGAQPRALANGVLQYARYIDRLETLGPMVQQIVQKHVSLQVLPEHYPIVGSCLLRAIREVLGAEIATDAVIDAWGAAYNQLAQLLIGAEGAIYDARAEATGGWRGARRFRVAQAIPESQEIQSFYLVPEDGGALLDFKAGQYLGLRLMLNGEEVRRNYSLSAAPNGRAYRISVKREPGGRASQWLHESIREGDALEVFPPAGEFTLTHGTKPLVLLSGGVGITPVLAMLESALAQTPTRPIYFIHFARNAAVHAFRSHVDRLAKAHPTLRVFYAYEHVSPADERAPHAVGRASEELLQQWLPQTRDLDAYFVGPKPFMGLVRRTLAAQGVPTEQTHFEFFGPAEALD